MLWGGWRRETSQTKEGNTSIMSPSVKSNNHQFIVKDHECLGVGWECILRVRELPLAKLPWCPLEEFNEYLEI